MKKKQILGLGLVFVTAITLFASIHMTKVEAATHHFWGTVYENEAFPPEGIPNVQVKLYGYNDTEWLFMDSDYTDSNGNYDVTGTGYPWAAASKLVFLKHGYKIKTVYKYVASAQVDVSLVPQ